MKLPDHPEKYMSWSSLERKFLEPYFNEITKLKEEIKRLRKEISELKATIETYVNNANHAVDIHAKDAKTIADIKNRALEESNKYVAYCNLAESKITELQAHNNLLREALEACKYVIDMAMTDKDGNKFMYLNTRSGSMLSALDTLDKCDQALASTPAQSLKAHDAELIERCAKVYDDNKYHPGIARLVREMKVK